MNVRFFHEGSLEMKIRPTLTGIVVCLTVAACSSFQAYEGPPRPDNETALIKTTTITSRFVQGGVPPRSFLISVDALELQDLGEIGSKRVVLDGCFGRKKQTFNCIRGIQK